MRRMFKVSRVIILPLLMGACASTMGVSSHVDRGADFGRYRTYDWGPADALPTGDPRLDRNPTFKDQLQGEVDRQLRLKGIALASAGQPDLLLHYHAAASERLDVSGLDQNYAYGGEVRAYDAGTILIDVVDARTQRLIWRGWAQGALTDMLDDDAMTKRLREAVRQMLVQLPLRP
jgi:hypothetical protein